MLHFFISNNCSQGQIFKHPYLKIFLILGSFEDETCSLISELQVYVNGTKGNDNIRVHDLNIYYGTCRDVGTKREAPEGKIQCVQNKTERFE